MKTKRMVMMSNSTVVLASGVVVGFAAVYAYKNDITLDVILDKFEENKEKFLKLVDNLIKLGAELLEKLFDIIEELVRTLVFKYKLVKSNI